MTDPDPDRLADAEQWLGTVFSRTTGRERVMATMLLREYDRRGREIVELKKKLDIHRRLSDDLARALTEQCDAALIDHRLRSIPCTRPPHDDDEAHFNDQHEVSWFDSPEVRS